MKETAYCDRAVCALIALPSDSLCTCYGVAGFTWCLCAPDSLGSFRLELLRPSCENGIFSLNLEDFDIVAGASAGQAHPCATRDPNLRTRSLPARARRIHVQLATLTSARPPGSRSFPPTRKSRGHLRLFLNRAASVHTDQGPDPRPA